MKKENKDVIKYYSLDNILNTNSDYNIIVGERSNGKTYAVLEYALKNYIKYGQQTAYIRRWREDITPKRMLTLFANHVANDLISKETKNEYNTIVYKNGKFYLACENNEKDKMLSENAFCYSFALSDMEHDKSTSYPNITTIVFDEFLTRRYYLPDEFMLFMNILSTIIRQRNNVKIFMLGNTVNKYCPYFNEMGLMNITTQKQGTIDIYEFGKDGAKIAVEYTASLVSKKSSNKYFCFDNENLKMITQGRWELSIYPHLPTKYKPKDIKFIFYIIFGSNTLQCNIICTNKDNFIFIHTKTTPIKNENNSLIYSIEPNSKPNYRKRLISTLTPLDTKISKYFACEKVFYQSNEIGEIVRNYLKLSVQNNLTN